ncbi:MAG TPA: chemotaxis protein CheB, partial [Thermoanaerobaculia bacterium]|nr:chemotaxis protein CheB [Thermoanaerobaculia bacterium]
MNQTPPRKSKARAPGGTTRGKSQRREGTQSAETSIAAGAAVPDQLFPVVGIGASAGGLAALKRFFAHVPKDSGLAYVVVVHLSPEHESRFGEILQPHVKMPVNQVTKTTALEKNCVYVIPPNSNLEAIDTHLRLADLEARRQERAPIDHFFRTLAGAHGDQAIGVVLSGTGSDGSLGLRRIKECGGLTVVQDPAEAEYDSMPKSAIASALVDLVLPVEKMAQTMLRYVRTQPRLPVPREGEDVQKDDLSFLQKVFAVVQTRTGRDFSHYKRSTLLRRISRRMQFNHLQEPSAYLELLRGTSREVQALADDLLVNVTSFFRDPEVFELLERNVVPHLFEGKSPGDTVRVWAVGCATGEEAYSLAILLLEEAARREAPPAVHVFASDLHKPSLDKARGGLYPGDIATDIRPDRLERFFENENGGYRVRRAVREVVVFAQHNVLSDPPFSRLDLVSCRNLFIYLDRNLHQQVAELFHYALKPDGYLLLGTSESIEESELFRTEDKKHRVYRRRHAAASEPRLPVFSLARRQLAEWPPGPRPQGEPAAFGAFHQRMVEQYAPPSVLLSPDDHVVHFSAHAGRYLAHPGGAPTTSVFQIVRDELRFELRSALSAVRSHRKAVRTRPIPVRFDGQAYPVVLDVRPALDPEQEGFVLVIFDERPAEP